MRQQQKMEISIKVPTQGIDLKLFNKFVLGTLTIEQKGIIFNAVKAKKRNKTLLTWGQLKAISKSGLI